MKILIFGGAGSLGTELVSFYRNEYCNIVVASRDEAKHWDLKNKFGTKHHVCTVYQTNFTSYVPGETKIEEFSTLSTIVCDVRDKNRVKQVLREVNPDKIILAQALKQVDTCEENPTESVETNILGTRNVIEAIEERNEYHTSHPKVCFVSTDKACNPINTYGMCKSISEKMVLAISKKSKSEYVITRYGNVISSKGSIIPLFLKQAETAKSFTVTHPEMTRFMMLLSESVELIDRALMDGTSGEIWLPKLDSFRVQDLAEYFSEKYNKLIKIVGIRPGEKMHEILMTEEEGRRWEDRNKKYVIPTVERISLSKDIKEHFDYSSDKFVINKQELKRRLDLFLETGTYDR